LGGNVGSGFGFGVFGHSFDPKQSRGVFFRQPYPSPIPAKPMVLGAQDSVRGEAEVPAEPKKVAEIIDSKVSAKSYIVFDAKSGAVLAERNAEEQLSIASLTKLMTALLAYEHTDISSTTQVRSSDKIQVTPILRLAAGDEVKIEDVISSMLVGSNNDAALLLSRVVSENTGKPFAELMNERASRLGMVNSHFSNPMGFDSWYNFSTAKDLKKLILETQKLALFSNLGKTKQYSFKGSLGYTYATKTTNKLLAKDESLESIKTGFTLDAKGAMATKISHGNSKFIVLVLGSQNRELDTLLLKQSVIEAYEWP
jgi:serine-type D-Ala-D-Ala carboxypeptidase (penicillin-binding protein 5/6)